MGVVDPFAGALVGEVQPGKLTGVGGILEAEIDGIGAFIHRPLQGRQVAGRADELHVALLAVWINPTMLVDYPCRAFDAGHGEAELSSLPTVILDLLVPGAAYGRVEIVDIDGVDIDCFGVSAAVKESSLLVSFGDGNAVIDGAPAFDGQRGLSCLGTILAHDIAQPLHHIQVGRLHA